MKQVNVVTQKTARYFQLGELTTETEYVIIACHGYGQLANYFLKWFEGIDTDKYCVVAPEGLHRFYWKGFSGRVVASWMTKEEREEDINDYIVFLDTVAKQFEHKKIIALGFSQGGATISRWVANTKLNIDKMILWGGVFPEDIPLEKINKASLSSPIQLTFGDTDEYYTQTTITKIKDQINKLEINAEITSFAGGHKILIQPLTNLLQILSVS